MPDSTAVTHCVLLWARPGQEAALAAYEDQVLTLMAEHDGRILQRGTICAGDAGAPDAGVPDAGAPDAGAPTEVQILEFASAAAMDAYIADPRRTAMAAERDAAIARTDVYRIRLNS